MLDFTNDPLGTVVDLLAYSSIIPISLFIYFYATRPVKGHKWLRRPSRLWRTTQVGRTLMYQTIAWLVYLSFITATLLWGKEWEVREFIRALIYIGIVYLFWRLFFNLRHAQKLPESTERTRGLNLDSDVERTQPRTPRR